MFFEFNIFFLFLLLFFFYKFVVNRISKKIIKYKHIVRWNLPYLVLTFKLIFHLLYINMLQYLNKSVVKVTKNKYIIEYVINGQNYKLFVFLDKTQRVLQIIDSNDNDVTDNVVPFLGPNYKLHNQKIYPYLLGYKTLTFELTDGTEIYFEKYQPINIV